MIETAQIITPEPDATVHDNDGNLTVTVIISPPIRAEDDNYLSLLLDGTEVASRFEQNVELTNIDRGLHTLELQVKAADGTVIITSPPVSFLMWRASRLLPSGKSGTTQ